MKQKTDLGILISVLVLATSATGCGGLADPEAVSRRVSELSEIPFETVNTVTVGRSAFRIARIATRAAEAEPPALVRDLDDLQWGTFRPTGSIESFQLRPSDFAGYSPVFARQATTGEHLLLLSRGSGERVKELLMVILGSERLTVIQVRGRLEGLLEDAVRLALGHAERPDLVEDAVQSLASSDSEL